MQRPLYMHGFFRQLHMMKASCRTYCEGRNPDKGEVGGSSPPTPTIFFNGFLFPLRYRQPSMHRVHPMVEAIDNPSEAKP